MSKHSSKRAAMTTVAGVALASALLLTGCWDKSAEQRVASGKARMDKQDYRAAVIEFKNALQQDASSAEARFWLGKALLESGDVQGAMVELLKAREAGYKKDDLVPAIAAAMILRGDIDKFIAEYADVQLADAKQQSELKAALATAYGARSRFDKAQAAADAALRADPNNIVAQLAVAQLQMVRGDMSAALAQVDRTAQAHPNAARPWVTKADILQIGNAPAADVIAAYAEAIKRDDNNFAAHLGTIGQLMQMRDLDGAEKQIAALEKVQPDNLQVAYFRTMLAMERRDLKTAHEGAQYLLKAAPSNARFLHLAGAIDYERGAYLQAIASLGKALPNAQNPIAVRVLLARAQLRAGDPRKALTFVQPLLDADSNMPPEVYSVAADAYLQAGNGESAKKMYAKVVQVDPKDTRGRTVLALANLREGRPEQAVSELKAIAAGAGGGEALMALIVADIRGNQLEKALAGVDDLERKLPNQPVPPFLRAQIEQRLGHPAKARELFELALVRQPTYLPAVAALTAMDEADGNVGAAVKRYERLVAADPTSVVPTMGLISLRARAGVKPQELQAQLEAAVKRFPGAADPRIALVTQLLEQGDTKAALQAANEAVSRFPDNARIHEMLGLAEMRSGNINQATQAFSKMASLLPHAAEPQVRLAEAALARRDVPSAIQQFRKAISVKPDYIPAHAKLITLLSRAGKFDEALAQAKALQTQQPALPFGWTFEGDLQASKGNKTAAVTALRTSFAKAPGGETALKLHRALLAADQRAEADKLAAEWLSKQPNDPKFNFYLGDMAMGRKDYDRAEQQYRKVIAAQPTNAVALNNLAWLLHRAGRPGAMEFAEKAVALAPDAPPFMDTLAEIQAAAGQWEKALALQKRVVELSPDEPSHRLHLARYLIKNNKNGEARVELQKLVQLGASFAEQEEVRKLMSSL
jgi:putative PEP-CTERM system TPR-repeat lipoprotein